MSWVEQCEAALLEGASINVVGLSGSGRSQSLHQLRDYLTKQGWSCALWTPEALDAMSRQDMKAGVSDLRDTTSLPVLLVDDFGDFLVANTNGPWLERMLFSAAHEDPTDDGEYLRCVLATYPRDREIVGPGSVLRERAKVIPPSPPVPAIGELDTWEASSPDDLLSLTGRSSLLASVGGPSPSSRRGNATAQTTAALPTFVGQLDGAHQKRLGTILGRAVPARWRENDADPILRPLMVAVSDASGVRCQIPEVVESNELLPLLLSERWPEREPRASARRFAARCGNEPNPIWVDNYLSDLERLDFNLLAGFLSYVIGLRPTGTGLRLLSRDFVAGHRVQPKDLGIALAGAGLGANVQERIEWKVYDQRLGTNLHRRELLLPRRGAGFSLPIVSMLVGQSDLGNETDAELTLPDAAPTHAAWANGVPVPWP
ncbi:MAG: hypothetical protein KF906_05570 [Actinobacteria bacterium]|nr:hypothetical protein [Actinomycetota bacterium]